MDVTTLLLHGGDKSLPMPSFEATHAFLREHYLHSRFEGSESKRDFPAYAQSVTESSLEQLLERGYGVISEYDCNRGRAIWFDRSLRVLNPDEAPAQIQRKPGNLTHIYGQALA